MTERCRTGQELSEAFVSVVDLAHALGVREVYKVPGLWKHDIDDQWSVSVNGHAEEIDSVPPYAVAITNRKYLCVGVLRATGGMITGGQQAEDDFIAATKAATQRIRAGQVRT